MEDYTESLKAIEKSIDYVGLNLPETAHLYTDGIEAAISDGFSKLGPALGGQWFDKSLENIDEHLKALAFHLLQIRVSMDSQTESLHDIKVSLRHLAELKAGRKLDGYWEDVDY